MIERTKWHKPEELKEYHGYILAKYHSVNSLNTHEIDWFAVEDGKVLCDKFTVIEKWIPYPED